MIILAFIYLILISLFYLQMISGVLFTTASLISLILMMSCNFYMLRRFSLFLIFEVGFVYIILSEMIILSYEKTLDYQDIKAMSFLSFGNFMFIIGYLFIPAKNKINITKEYEITSRKKLLLVIILMYIFFVTFRLADVIKTMLVGRELGDSLGSGSILGEFLLAAGYVLPSLIGFYAIRYYPSKKWRSLLFVFPLFVIGALMGARYKLLFMLIPYLVLMDIFSVKRMTFKKVANVALLGIFLMSLSTIIKFTRSSGIDDKEISISNGNDDKKTGFSYWLAYKMSPENVVEMTKYGNRYFDDEGHPYLYGTNCSFIFYIWIPRNIWKDKPTPLDYWLIRKYENVVDAASTASGFIGDFRADFGYFSLLIVLLIGMQFKRLDNYLNALAATSDKNLLKIVIGFCYAWVFFFVRSPITSTISIMIALAMLFFLLKFTTKKVSLLKLQSRYSE